MHPMLNIAVRAARRAGDIISRQYERVSDLRADLKGLNDYVTEVDKQAEAAILDTLLTAYPTHSVLAEESGSTTGTAGEEFLWIIDPLDGTTNFIHGFPQFAVSIALSVRGRLSQAVVYDPLKQELFTASQGAGAQLNGRRIRVSKQRTLKGALLGTGFPYRDMSRLEQYLSIFRALTLEASGIRRAGAASLDLAYVACGRLDGFWEFGLKSWDIAAGALLIEESGGMLKGMSVHEDFLHTGNVITANADLIDLLMDQVLSSSISKQ